MQDKEMHLRRDLWGYQLNELETSCSNWTASIATVEHSQFRRTSTWRANKASATKTIILKIQGSPIGLTTQRHQTFRGRRAISVVLKANIAIKRQVSHRRRDFRADQCLKVVPVNPSKVFILLFVWGGREQEPSEFSLPPMKSTSVALWGFSQGANTRTTRNFSGNFHFCLTTREKASRLSSFSPARKAVALYFNLPLYLEHEKHSGEVCCARRGRNNHKH